MVRDGNEGAVSEGARGCPGESSTCVASAGTSRSDPRYQLSFLARLAAIANRSTDLRSLLAEALPLVLEAVGLRTGWVTLRNASGGFDLVAAQGLPLGLAADDTAALRWYPCHCQQLAARGELGTTVNVVACERLARVRQNVEVASQAGDPAGSLSWHYTVPLRLPDGAVLGLLNLAHRQATPLDDSTRAFLDAIGEVLASAVERAELVRELRRLRSAEREAVTQLARALVGRERLPDVAEALFDALTPVLRPDALSLLVVEPSERFLVLRAARGWAVEWLDRLWLPLASPTHNGPAWALHQREPFAVRLDELPRPFHVPPMVLLAGVRVSAFFPLLTDARPVGVVVANYRSAVELSPDQLAMGTLLTEIGALAVARAVEFEHTERLLSDLPVGVFRLDANGVLLRGNRTLARLLGMDDERALAGLRLQQVFVDAREASRCFARLRDTDLLLGTECLWRKSDGTPIWVRFIARAERTPEGELVLIEGIVEDITERKRAEERLVHLAHHDPLTDIPNRHALIEALENALARAWRTGQGGALLLFDLDNFKVVNDRLGHMAGDSVLRTVASRMLSAVRSGELVARLGGDEFAILLFPMTASAAVSVGERVLRTLREIPVALPEQVVRLQASCGIALLPEHGTTVEELLTAADRALYTVKSRGGGAVEVFDVQRHRPVGPFVPLGFRQRLEAALANADLVTLAQPILDLRRRVTVGYEFLVRLRDGDRLLEPSSFLPAAERLGLLPRVDQLVVEQAIRLARSIEGRIHVNVSSQTIHDPDTRRTFFRILRQGALPPGRLVLEVTESAAVTDVVGAREFLETVRRLGCSVALDDFGVGFSSLYQLRSLPVDFLKIDGAFIARLLESEVDQRIIRAIVDLAQAIGARTIAEWVETETLLDLLEALGVDEAQGYAIGKPRSGDDFGVGSPYTGQA